MKTKTLFLISMIVFSLFSSIASAQRPKQVPLGVRPIGMGEAFVALADDANAVAWNPAGIAQIGRLEANSMYANLFGIDGLYKSNVGLVFPATKNFALGFDWGRQALNDKEDTELAFSQDIFRFAFGKQWEKIFSLPFNFKSGGAFKILQTDMSMDRFSVGKASGWGTDFGFLIIPTWLEQLSLGWMVQDFGGVYRDATSSPEGREEYAEGQKQTVWASGTSVRYRDDDTREVILPRHSRFGIAYHPTDNLFLTLDMDDRIHFGSELWFHPTFSIIPALRAGIQKDLVTQEGLTLSFGGSLRIQRGRLDWLQFDTAYVHSPTLQGTLLFSVSGAFDVRPSPVKIEEVRLVYPELYAALYRAYQQAFFGEIALRNTSDKPVDVKVKAFGKVGMDSPIEVTGFERLNQKEAKILRMKSLIFNQKLWQEYETAGYLTISFSVVSISSEDQTREAQTARQVWVNNRNSIDWREFDAPKQLGAFISADNPAVVAFMDVLQRRFPQQDAAKEKLNPNLYKAMVVLETLASADVRYVTDPNHSAGSRKLDYIRYPHEMLQSPSSFPSSPEAEIKLGDCDDVTVLYCSLLERWGVPTALLIASNPPHVLMAFRLFDQPNPMIDQFLIDRYGDVDGVFWAPVETTLLNEGFLTAWQSGMETMKNLREELPERLLPISFAQESYPSAQVIVRKDAWEEKVPAREEVLQRLKKSIEAWKNWQAD
jgi:hypothetical protein